MQIIQNKSLISGRFALSSFSPTISSRHKTEYTLIVIQANLGWENIYIKKNH